MGILKSKADFTTQEASRAYAKGDHVLVFKFIEAASGSRYTGPMSDVAQQIEAVESAGWMLSNMSVGEGKALSGERIALVCLFRRQACTG